MEGKSAYASCLVKTGKDSRLQNAVYKLVTAESSKAGWETILLILSTKLFKGELVAARKTKVRHEPQLPLQKREF